MKLSVITPTGGRPEAFALCELWMSRQTVQPYEWIVVDDCDPATPCTMGQTVVRPEPRWRPGGKPTNGRNLLAGLDCVTGDATTIVEDDDWYAPQHIEALLKLLGRAPLVGEGLTRYYNLHTRRWANMRNSAHACLATTAWLQKFAGTVKTVIETNEGPCYDLTIWRRSPESILNLGTRNHIGIKCMPGRPGIAHGHTDHCCRQPDPELHVLRGWIGDDVERYRPFMP